jgi:hypothetical protein
LTCILARKIIWKVPATTLPNTLIATSKHDRSRILFSHPKK